MSIQKITQDIINHTGNAHKTSQGILPLFTASKDAKIIIIGQAPGQVAEKTRKPWNDVSGRLLREWLGLSDDVFYGKYVSLMPMDFYYPGKGKHGDLPPRKDFAPLWHPKLLAEMPNVELTVLIGQYSQKYYLADQLRTNLTETVRAYKEYLPQFLPLVHPSPLNFRWRSKNPWFDADVIPHARKHVQKIIG